MQDGTRRKELITGMFKWRETNITAGVNFLIMHAV